MQTEDPNPARGDSPPANDRQEASTEPEATDSWTQTAELLDLCELIDGDDPLDAFAPEAEGPKPDEVEPTSVGARPARTTANTHELRIKKDARPVGAWRRSAVGVSALVLMALFAAAYRPAPRDAADLRPAVDLPKAGRVSIATEPAGAEAWIDGRARGATPLALDLPPGSHTLELRLHAQARALTLTIKPGVETAHYIELGATTAIQTGQLQVESPTAGSRVVVDRQVRGVTPLTVPNLSAGEHEVVLSHDAMSIRRTVTVQAGATTTLFVTPGTAGATAIGWMTVKTPIMLEAFEDGRLLGTTAMDRIGVAAGEHTIEFVNDTLGFSRRQTVKVDAGRTLTLSIEVPKGVAHINALPWAEVTVDRKVIGETPVGNLELPIGPHEVVLRHPQFGERRQTIIVTAAAPVKLGVDLRK